MYSCFTESLFHTSFLVKKLKNHNLTWIVRNSRELDCEELNEMHSMLSKKKFITKNDLNIIEKSYRGLSEAEKYLALTYGVPELHPLKLAKFVSTIDFNDDFFSHCTEGVNAIDKSGAIIFLSVILKNKWIDFFEQKIVNAHPAVLPYARGMFAIEQFLVDHNQCQFEQAAGATIHYIDMGIDTGPIIETAQLKRIWDLESIWAVKGESYLLAFELMKCYLTRGKIFTLTDCNKADKTVTSPLYFSRNFSLEVKKTSENKFRTLKCNNA